VVAVLHEVQLADPVHVDRGHRLAAALRGRHPLPARAHLARGGPEAAIELATAIHRAHDGVERDDLLAQLPLAAAPEGRHHLLEREDHVHVARLAAQAVPQAGERTRAPGAGEVELRVGFRQAGVLGHPPSDTRRACNPPGA
jgi:hypothetical protein